MNACEYYRMIYKRKSFHVFPKSECGRLTAEELDGIEKAMSGFCPLYPDIKTAFRIVPADKISMKRDAEYCILLYSEEKENHLTNIGYIGEQLDLYLVAHNIGSLWCGLAKPDRATYNGLSYVIMIPIHKIGDETAFRKDMYKAKRKPLSDTWSGDDFGDADTARFAPSACNSQPWYVKSENGVLTVYRHRKPGRVGIMPPHAVSYFNRIDMGIYLFILEICLKNRGYSFERALFVDDGGDAEKTKVATYRLCAGN